MIICSHRAQQICVEISVIVGLKQVQIQHFPSCRPDPDDTSGVSQHGWMTPAARLELSNETFFHNYGVNKYKYKSRRASDDLSDYI